MTRTLRWASAIVCLLVFTAGARAADPAHRPQLPKAWSFTLPGGDAEAGKAAFEKMECYSCHRVPGAGLPKERSSGGIGPDLAAGYAKLPAGFLAESIMSRHQYISGTLEKYTGGDKVSSKMGDYSSIMTVRELIDIVAFLKHLGPPSAEHH
jgi:cytochrome c2